MYSIHKLKKVAMAVLLVAGASTGCQKVIRDQTVALSTTPIVEDEAMRQREWSLTKARYQNGGVDAWSTGFVYQTSEQIPDWEGLFVDQGLFLGQTVALPVTLIMSPPWEPVMYRGVVTPATYTAVPPIEEANQ